MGRKKIAIQKIENPTSCHVAYTKRKECIVKKAKELSILCEANVGIIMFKPSGHLTTFATNGRVEDIFLRFVDMPIYLREG
ncbi:hypothetical protein ACS0TY_013785 [Phlomoides rotata]